MKYIEKYWFYLKKLKITSRRHRFRTSEAPAYRIGPFEYSAKPENSIKKQKISGWRTVWPILVLGVIWSNDRTTQHSPKNALVPTWFFVTFVSSATDETKVKKSPRQRYAIWTCFNPWLALFFIPLMKTYWKKPLLRLILNHC